MLKKKLRMTAVAAMVIVLLHSASSLARAAQAPAPALAGQVSSQEEGPMEGVLVTAREAGSTTTITVVSDQMGRYYFPRTRLEPGKYSLSIRAVGYEADDPAVEIIPGKIAQANLKLHRTGDISAQLTNAEWLMSMPDDDRKVFLLGCTMCHTLQRVVRSHLDPAAFSPVVQRMWSYASGSSPLFPQFRPGSNPPAPAPKMVEYLSSINLSKVSKWEYPFKTLPRPKGRATRVIITEYGLPREVSQPHDVIVDSDGIAWYSDFGQQYLGKLDPKTGKATEYPVPLLEPQKPLGGLEVEQDREGNIWLSTLEQAAIARFDRKTEKLQTFSLPPDLKGSGAHIAMVMPVSSHVDGKVWLQNGRGALLQRLDLATGKFDSFKPFRESTGVGTEMGSANHEPHGLYGISADSRNNLYFVDYQGAGIGKLDAKTGEVKLYRTPTGDSAPRRGRVDSEDRFWFAEYMANKIGMFDPRKETIQEWTLPSHTEPYDVVTDKNREVWTGGMSTDRIVRLDPKSGQTIQYLLPQETNLRRVFVDNSTTPVTFWVGNNHHASIIKLEPLD